MNSRIESLEVHGIHFSSCGARNAELITVGQKLIPAVRALIFAPSGIGSKSSVRLCFVGIVAACICPFDGLGPCASRIPYPPRPVLTMLLGLGLAYNLGGSNLVVALVS